jgi:hypothetical protein
MMEGVLLSCALVHDSRELEAFSGLHVIADLDDLRGKQLVAGFVV